jgi:mycothiol synthase
MRRPSLQALPDLSALLPPGYTLREQRPDEDMAGLAALLQAAFPEHTWTPEKAHEALVADATVKTIFVIEHDGAPVATASARLLPDSYPDSGYVHWVAAIPPTRAGRLGYVATLATLHAFVRLGCRDAVLETDDFRLPAIKTYLRLGFVPEFRHPSHPERWAQIEAILGELSAGRDQHPS